MQCEPVNDSEDTVSRLNNSQRKTWALIRTFHQKINNSITVDSFFIDVIEICDAKLNVSNLVIILLTLGHSWPQTSTKTIKHLMITSSFN